MNMSYTAIRKNLIALEGARARYKSDFSAVHRRIDEAEKLEQGYAVLSLPDGSTKYVAPEQLGQLGVTSSQEENPLLAEIRNLRSVLDSRLPTKRKGK